MHYNRKQHLIQHSVNSSWAQFCPLCGGSLAERYIEIEQRTRRVCSNCGFIFYINPKVVAATIPRQNDHIWLLRRNIEPSLGRWTFPGGYVDLGESVKEAAIRETREETLLEVRIDSLLNIYSYVNAAVIMIVYCATVIAGIAGITAESQEIRAFQLADIPWTDLAFPSTRDALMEYVAKEKG